MGKYEPSDLWNRRERAEMEAEAKMEAKAESEHRFIVVDPSHRCEDLAEIIYLLKLICFATIMSLFMSVIVVAWICHLWIKGL